jgi:hypothetical protein
METRSARDETISFWLLSGAEDPHGPLDMIPKEAGMYVRTLGRTEL